jgi:hypothetical protein
VALPGASRAAMVSRTGREPAPGRLGGQGSAGQIRVTLDGSGVGLYLSSKTMTCEATMGIGPGRLLVTKLCLSVEIFTNKPQE